jgi:hypothetical protein
MKTNKHLHRLPGTLLRVTRSAYIGAMLMPVLFLLQPAITAGANTPQHLRPVAEWILDKTVSNVDFYYMISECDGKKVVFLKFVNRNNSKVKVSWKEVFSTQFEKKREGFKGKKELVLSKGETSESACNQVNVKECFVLPSEVSATYLAEISSFTFSDVQVITSA